MLKVKKKPEVEKTTNNQPLPPVIFTDEIVDQEFPIVPNKTLDDFLSDGDIDFIKSFLENLPERNLSYIGKEPSMPENFIEKCMFTFTNDVEYDEVTDLITEKLKKTFHPKIKLGNCHILTAYFPYRAHTNAMFGEYKWDKDNYAAWNITIPLDDYPCNSIIFNEKSYKTKLVPEWIKDQPQLNAIDAETFEKYLSLEYDYNMSFLSIDEIVEWKKGRCIANSRYKFSGHDNFLPKTEMVQAIIIQTALPNFVEF